MSVLQSPHQTRHPAPSHLPVGHHTTSNSSSSGNNGGSENVHQQEAEEEEEVVTPIPHQIRGSLHQFTQMDITVRRTPHIFCMIYCNKIFYTDIYIPMYVVDTCI